MVAHALNLGSVFSAAALDRGAQKWFYFENSRQLQHLFSTQLELLNATLSINHISSEYSLL
jgi:hypothetical protein